MAGYRLTVTPKAVAEIQEAIDYYNNVKPGLGKRFYQDLNRQLNTIKQNPQYKSVRYGIVRMAHLDKFPYAAHYYFEDDRITINAVLCDLQNLNTVL